MLKDKIDDTRTTVVDFSSNISNQFFTKKSLPKETVKITLWQLVSLLLSSRKLFTKTN